jgi:hypothetical protein
MSYKPTPQSDPDFLDALIHRGRFVPGGMPDADDVLSLIFTREERDRVLDIAGRIRGLEK